MSGKPVNRRVQFTKNALREAMIELITEKPLTSITVKDVCARADINCTTRTSIPCSSRSRITRSTTSTCAFPARSMPSTSLPPFSTI